MATCTLHFSSDGIFLKLSQKNEAWEDTPALLSQSKNRNGSAESRKYLKHSWHSGEANTVVCVKKKNNKKITNNKTPYCSHLPPYPPAQIFITAFKHHTAHHGFQPHKTHRGTESLLDLRLSEDPGGSAQDYIQLITALTTLNWFPVGWFIHNSRLKPPEFICAPFYTDHMETWNTKERMCQ